MTELALKRTKLFAIVSLIIASFSGFSALGTYSEVKAQPSPNSAETYILNIELTGKEQDQYTPGEVKYQITGFQSNATDLKGIRAGEGLESSVDVNDKDVWVYTTLKIPDPTNPRKSSVTDIASFLDVVSIEELENGLKIYEVEPSYSTGDIGRYAIIGGVLNQTSANEATLSLRLALQ